MLETAGFLEEAANAPWTTDGINLQCTLYIGSNKNQMDAILKLNKQQRSQNKASVWHVADTETLTVTETIAGLFSVALIDIRTFF